MPKVFKLQQLGNVIQQILNAVAGKAEQSDLNAHTGNGDVHVSTTDKNRWNDTYTKTQVDERIEQGGKVKTVSVNGGSAVQPDEHGNIDIEVPTDLKDLNGDSTHRTVTDEEKSAWSGKQDTIDDLDAIRSGAGKGSASVQGVKMEGDDNPLTPDGNGVVTIPQPEIPDSVTSVLVNNELVFQTSDGQSVKGKVGITTGADGLLHLTLTDEEGNTFSSPIAGLRVSGNALQYSNDGETWVTVQTFGNLTIKYVQASDPASGDEGDLALVGSTNAYVLKVYVGGSWVSVCDFGTLDLTSDGITMAGENKTLTEKMAEVVDASISPLDTEKRVPATITNSYWTYENDQPVSTAGDGKTFKACVVDVTGFDALLLNFYLLASYGAKSFFTNDEDVMVGDFLTKNTKVFQKFDVPDGATKLYITSDVRQIGIGIIGLNENTAISLLEDMTKTVDVPSSSWIQGSVKGAISGATYVKYDSWSYPKFIPIADGSDEIIVETGEKNAIVAFVTNTTMSNGGTVPYAEGESGVYTLLANGTHLLKVPSGAKYLHCSQGNNTQIYPLSVVCRLSVMAQVREITNTIEANVGDLSDELEDLSRSVYEDAEVDSSKWTIAGFNGSISSGNYISYSSWDKPKFVPIEYAKKIVVTTGEKRAIIAFVTTKDGATAGSPVPFAEGETSVKTLDANGTHILDVPSDAKYIFTAQKLAENWQFPISVVCKYTAFTQVKELEEKMCSEVETLDNKKQDKVYIRDLSDGDIREGYDALDSNHNKPKRVSILYQKCYKGDIIKIVSTDGLAQSGKMKVAAYDRNKNVLSNTGAWITNFTISEDGYYTALIEATAENGTSELLLASITHYTPIEANTERVLSERWENNAFDKTIKRLTFDNGYKVYPYVGESPFKNTVRMKYLGLLSGSGNQSMAFYGDYLFTFSKGVGVVIFDLAFNKVGQIAKIEEENTNECNAAYFSDEFVDPADEFPIVYVETIYTTPYVKGYRIRRNNGIWSIEMVHEINTEVSHGNLVIYDRQNDDLIYVTFSNNASFYRFHRPKYADSSDGVSTLMETDMVSVVPLVNDLVDYYAVMGYRHDVSVCGNIAFGLTYNMESPLNNRLFGVDLTTGKTVFFFPFAWAGETECLEWYCGRLYFKDNGQRFYELIIEGGNIEPFNAGTRRPTSPTAGYSMFDTNLGKPIWYTGSGWVDASGQSV